MKGVRKDEGRERGNDDLINDALMTSSLVVGISLYKWELLFVVEVWISLYILERVVVVWLDMSADGQKRSVLRSHFSFFAKQAIF